MAKQIFKRVIREGETTQETTGNSTNSRPSSNTVTRPTTSNTVTRPTSSNTVTRPSSNTVTRPTTSNTVTRPSSSNTVTRPSSNTVTRPSSSGRPVRPSTSGRGTSDTGRVDAPVGKGQYINAVKDTTTMEVRYSIDVKDPGRFPEQVAELVVGPGWRQVVSNVQTDINISSPEANKDSILERASKAIALGAKVQVYKYIKIVSSFPGLKPGTAVTDKGEVRSDYKMSVRSWGNSRSKVQELVLGTGVSSNLQISLPLELEYPEWEKNKMLQLAQQLLDLGAGIDISKETGIVVPLV